MTTALALLGSKKQRAVTGSSTDNCIKVWSIGACDITSEHTYRDAHATAVAALASKPDDDHLFASCAQDRNLLIWDYRSLKPVIQHVNQGPTATAIEWTVHNGAERILLGDVSGIVHVYDPRNIQKALQSIKACDRSTHRFRCNNNLVAVVSQSNKIAVLDASAEYTTVYRDQSADDSVRDIHWTGDKTFNSLAWGKSLAQHSF